MCSDSEIQGKGTFEYPPIRGDCEEPGQKTFKHYPLAEIFCWCVQFTGHLRQTGQQGLPEGGGTGVFHRAVSSIARLTRSATRCDRPCTAASRRERVVRPSRSACLALATICSGPVPASAESTMLLAAFVTRTVPRLTTSFCERRRTVVWIRTPLGTRRRTHRSSRGTVRWIRRGITSESPWSLRALSCDTTASGPAAIQAAVSSSCGVGGNCFSL